MAGLTGRRIVLAVTGGVAAYKSAILTRRLVEAGARVRVVLSDEAVNFIGPTTFSALTGETVVRGLFNADLVSPHTDLGRWADLVVVAPATAATLGRLAHGISEEVVSATLLATRAPVLIAPAMHTEMWEHPATVRNLEQLRKDGHHIVGPSEGALAGGDHGIGRMAEPEEILAAIEAALAGPLQGWRVLVTAGGTREALDPVRYIGNRSSGKMGHAIANEASRRGAGVVLVTASDQPVDGDIDVVRIESAQEMAEACARVEPDVAVMAAAVADFRPSTVAETKLARSAGLPVINLEKTPDILASIGARRPRPFIVGFAAETGNLERAIEKAASKGVDLMVANDVNEPGAGFVVDTNRVSIIFPDGSIEDWPLMSKTEVAKRLWDMVQERIGARQGGR
ncbi:MAG: bifunctional phosphopantothenoylcysteine decarboxylase/phosphopantothenate--cysteine ligase CoaBC [Actinomycetota bacterium]